MKNAFPVLLLFLFLSNNCFAQTFQRKRSEDTTQYTIIEQLGKQACVVPTIVVIVNSYDLISMSLLTDHRNISRHVEIMRLKPNIKILSLIELLEAFHVKKIYWNLPVKLNGGSYLMRKNDYVSPNAVISIKLHKGQVDIIPNNSQTTFYLDITTKGPHYKDAID